MSLSSKIRVAVLRGGQSEEYDVSLRTGSHVLSLLREMPEMYEPADIFISKEGEWHESGLVEEPHKILRHSDIVWNALHGSYGEDGQVQRVLEGLQIPFTGSSAVASALSMNKDMTKRLYRQYSLLTPEHEIVTQDNFDDDRLIAIFRSYLHPVIVKPVSGGSSIGVHLVNSFKELKEAIKATLKLSKRVLVEEFVRGKEATCVVLEEVNGEKLYAFIPAGKSSLRTQENSPRFGEAGKRIEEISKKAHQILGLRHYSSSDFVITPKNNIYILETDSLPVFHEDSLAHQSIGHTGWRHSDFVDHVIKIALNK